MGNFTVSHVIQCSRNSWQFYLYVHNVYKSVTIRSVVPQQWNFENFITAQLNDVRDPAMINATFSRARERAQNSRGTVKHIIARVNTVII